MCGRFVQAQSAQSYAAHFGAVVALDEVLRPSWNVAPTDPVYAVAMHEGERRLGSFRWGLIPWFAKDGSAAARHINARSETAGRSPVFKESLASRRCLIPADGFYEWERRDTGGKVPHFIHAADGNPLALAGLWSSWRDPEGERVATCSILTTRPDALVAPIHDRMPVILREESWGLWLDRDSPDVEPILRGAGVTLAEYPVSTLVNSVRNNYPECTAPLR